MQDNIKVEVVEEIDEFLSVPVAQVTPGVVACDFSKFKSQIVARVEQCKEMKLNDNNYKDLVDVRIGINNSINLIKKYTSDLKKKVIAPYEEYEKQAKECIKLMEDAKTTIQTQLDDYDGKQIQEKRNIIKEYFEKLIVERGVKYIRLEQFWNPKWDNKAYTEKKVYKEINESLDNIGRSLDVLMQLDPTGSIASDFIRKLTFEGLQNNVLLNKLITEHNAREAQRIELMKQQEKKVEVVVEEPKVVKETSGYNFKLIVEGATQEQVTALAKFLKDNGYNFKMER
jgi:hypothetical protein